MNQHPEQKARDRIAPKLREAERIIQDKDKINFGAGPIIVVREYSTDVGPAGWRHQSQAGKRRAAHD